MIYAMLGISIVLLCACLGVLWTGVQAILNVLDGMKDTANFRYEATRASSSYLTDRVDGLNRDIQEVLRDTRYTADRLNPVTTHVQFPQPGFERTEEDGK